MRSMLVLEGLAILAVIVLLISAIWQRLAKEPEEDDP
jgi:Na+-transporting methylmalonyl-CoA/oxaloacetate decarboxylase gamma subunit